MQAEHKEKNLELERLVFFSDAIVAIAITLLALELRITPAHEHLAFSDLARSWHKFAAFFLSFVSIAVFWVNHHRFFVFIKAIDSKMMVYNMCWLLFIVLLPFSSSLISDDFFNKPAMFIYSINVLAVSIFQNMIWDHIGDDHDLAKSTLTDTIEREYRVGCNLAMGNAIFAIVLSFFSPVLAFITLLLRSMMFRRSAQQYLARLTARQQAKEKLLKRKDRNTGM